MKSIVLIIFAIILALVAVVLYMGSQSLPKPFENKASACGRLPC